MPRPRLTLSPRSPRPTATTRPRERRAPLPGMDTPDNAWKTLVAAWGEIPQKRVVDDIKRFESALDAIIAADGAYVSDKDLRNGHRMVMQRLVRGGAIRNEDNNGTKMTVEEGLEKIMASWK